MRVKKFLGCHLELFVLPKLFSMLNEHALISMLLGFQHGELYSDEIISFARWSSNVARGHVVMQSGFRFCDMLASNNCMTLHF